MLPISKLIIYDIRLNLHSFKDLISLDASILKELEDTVTSLSAVSQRVTQVQYPYTGVCYVTHSSQPNFRPIIGDYIISNRYYKSINIIINKNKQKNTRESVKMQQRGHMLHRTPMYKAKTLSNNSISNIEQQT